MERKNVLIFPAGSENAIDIYESLKYNLHFNVFGASGKSDYAEYLYDKRKLYIGNLYINEKSFISEFNKILLKFKIDFVIPSHDSIATYLTYNQNKLKAKVVCSPYETAIIAENKKLTYEKFKDTNFVPRIYENINEINHYPVFIKPIYGSGGKNSHIINDKNDLENLLKDNKDMIISEYLPGREYTIDCFTDKESNLLFIGPRTRERISMGIAFRSRKVENIDEISRIAKIINSKLKFRGSWYFQLKENKYGTFKLMEISVRHATTMVYYRQLGINFAALSLFDAMDYDIKIIFNDYSLTLDRCIKNSYIFNYHYNKIYIDFDDTIIVNGKVNTMLMRLIYQGVNSNKKIILISKHGLDINNSLKKYRINIDLFDEIIIIGQEEKKSNYIDKKDAVFIDNSFYERVQVKEECNIPVFDVDSIECLIDNRCI